MKTSAVLFLIALLLIMQVIRSAVPLQQPQQGGGIQLNWIIEIPQKDPKNMASATCIIEDTIYVIGARRIIALDKNTLNQIASWEVSDEIFIDCITYADLLYTTGSKLRTFKKNLEPTALQLPGQHLQINILRNLYTQSYDPNSKTYLIEEISPKPLNEIAQYPVPNANL